jgi:MFS family permease
MTQPAPTSGADAAPTTPASGAPAPALGGSFARLWSAAISSNLSDGIARLAIPLAAVSLTKDPVSISILTALAYVPWLLFGLPSGMIVDRIDRRYAMALANATRVVAAAGVALAFATGRASLPVLGVAIVIFGLGETLFDNATNAVIPAIVDRGGLDKANGRIQAAQVGVDMFVATPISGVLFSIAVTLPMFVAGAGYLIAGAIALSLPIAAARAGRTTQTVDGESERAITVREAMAFLFTHAYLRSMVVTTSLMGGFFALAQATSILFFIERHGVTPALIGVVTAGVGVGAVSGAITAERWVARFGRGRTMFGASIAGSASLAAVAAAPNIWVAVVAYAAGAAGVSMWNVPWGSLRQAIIPAPILGRVLGAMRTITWGLIPVATVLGGVLGRVDLALPFLVGGVGSLAVVLVRARLLLSADEHFPAEPDASAEPEDATTSGEALETAPEPAVGAPTRGDAAPAPMVPAR